MTSSSSSPQFSHIDINLIQVDRASRQRREIDSADLQESIQRLGLLQPPVVRAGDYRLMAGERRWHACQALGWQRIPVRWLESLDELEAQLVELAENIKRKALPWQDEVQAVARIHTLQKAKQPDLTTREFCDTVGLSQASLVRTLRVSKDLGDERISKASSTSEAYNILARRDQRAQGEALEELLGLGEPVQPVPSTPPSGGMALTPEGEAKTFGNVEDFAVKYVGTLSNVEQLAPPPPASPIQQASFLDWLASDASKLEQKFTFVHCDFPYGLELFAGKQGQGAEPTAGYQDEEQVYFELLEAFCTHLDSFMAMSAHLMFWFSAKHRQRTLEMFQRLCPSLIFYPYDLIWHKSDNAGIAGDYRRHPRHTYEQALLATRGGRHILGVVADSYAAPTDKRLHTSCKPEPMLRHFFQMFVDKESRVFDPTCGAGSSIRAANSLGASKLLGLELDPAMAEIAQREYRLRAKGPQL